MEEILKSYDRDEIMKVFRLKEVTLTEDEALARACDEDTSDVINKLICSICQNFFFDPVRCQMCKDVFFCRQCFEESKACPLCKQSNQCELKKFDANNLPLCILKCRNFRNGCEGKFNPEKLRIHENECDLKIYICLFCGAQVIKQDTKNHYEICTKMPTRCSECEKEMPREDLSIHIQECETVVCLKCQILLTRKTINDHDCKILLDFSKEIETQFLSNACDIEDFQSLTPLQISQHRQQTDEFLQTQVLALALKARYLDKDNKTLFENFENLKKQLNEKAKKIEEQATVLREHSSTLDQLKGNTEKQTIISLSKDVKYLQEANESHLKELDKIRSTRDNDILSLFNENELLKKQLDEKTKKLDEQTNLLNETKQELKKQSVMLDQLREKTEQQRVEFEEKIISKLESHESELSKRFSESIYSLKREMEMNVKKKEDVVLILKEENRLLRERETKL